ncbi:unnamed protein product [Paramecium octaurelia]|uniref:Uncharacterized protein n=1 Tax=Paramecium octaurelia TaxID=43137 RepID=A0A8S1VU88_PAROT|nr:unnamed protein product [Paramecium octaurelia]
MFFQFRFSENANFLLNINLILRLATVDIIKQYPTKKKVGMDQIAEQTIYLEKQFVYCQQIFMENKYIFLILMKATF